ncbi:MAG: hypothetical protein ABR969_09760 [Sedimentisphaerales bacterium]
MKKLILVLAIALMASPAFALTVVLQQEGTSNIVDVVYSGADSGNLPRAFALDVQIQSGNAKVSSIANYKSGESCDPAKGGTKGFGIYPARINIDTAGVPQSWGSPLAATSDPPGLDSNLPQAHVVLEFASLYFNNPGDHNEPNTSGTLCKLNLDETGQTTNYDIKMSAETTYRGGVVLENGQQFVMPDSIITIVKLTAPTAASGGTPQPNVTGLSVNLGWAAGTGATSHDVYFGTVLPVTPVNVVMPTVTLPTGTMIQGKTYYVKVVAKNGAGNAPDYTWNFSTDCMKSTAAEYTNWTTTNPVPKANCWCYEFQKMGDCDGKDEGTGALKKAIGAVDLTILKNNYGKKRATLTTEAMLSADIDHLDEGTGALKKAVGAVDLTVLKNNYGKKRSALPEPPAYAGDYYFWTVAP